MLAVTGRIKSYDGQALTIIAPFSDTRAYIRKRFETCEVRLDDGLKGSL